MDALGTCQASVVLPYVTVTVTFRTVTVTVTSTFLRASLAQQSKISNRLLVPTRVQSKKARSNTWLPLCKLLAPYLRASLTQHKQAQNTARALHQKVT